MFPETIDTRPLRLWVDDSLEWIVRYWGRAFEDAAYPLLMLLNTIERTLLAIPWWMTILVLTAIAAAASRRWGTLIAAPVVLLLFGFFGGPVAEQLSAAGLPPYVWAAAAAAVFALAAWQGGLAAIVLASLVFLGMMELWEDAVRTMALMITATLTAIAVSIPMGIAMSRSSWLRQVVTPVLDLMQTMPSFVYLIPTVMIFGPGKIPALLATIVYAAPPLVRLTDLGIRLVDPDIMEAARAFGTNPRQRLFGVQIPLALPTILAGINQTTMMALAMVVIASMIGAGGLGYQVLQGIGRLEVSRGLFAGLGIVVLAIIFDRITQAFGKQLQSRIGLAEARR